MAEYSFEAIAHALVRRLERRLSAGFRVWVARGALYVSDGGDQARYEVPYSPAATEDARRHEVARVMEQMLSNIEDYVTNGCRLGDRVGEPGRAGP